MITSWSWSVSVAEALYNANVVLTDPHWDSLGREDVEVLLEHIGNLEFEVSRLKGTFNVLEEH